MANEQNDQVLFEDDRTGLSVETLRRALADNLYYIQGKLQQYATKTDYYMALAYTVRDRLLQRWLHSTDTYLTQNVRVVSYLSAEFLVGPHLGNNLRTAIPNSECNQGYKSCERLTRR